MTAIRWWSLLVLMLSLATACVIGGGEEGAECLSNGDCGEGFACVAEECEDVTCVSSADCSLHQYCDGSFACVDGCGDDNDCAAGEACNTANNTCEAYGCRDTDLDCAYGEFCDVTTGQCYSDDAPHCEGCNGNTGGNACGDPSATCVGWDNTGQTCDAAENNSGCGPEDVCYFVEVQDTNGNGGGIDDFDQIQASAQCNNDNQCDPDWHCDGIDLTAYGGPIGNFCHRDYCYEHRCVVTCDPNDEQACPRGYACSDLYGDGSAYGCAGDCAYMEENGYLR